MSSPHILWTDKPLASGQRETSPAQSGADPDEGQLERLFLKGGLRDWFMDEIDTAVRIETGRPLSLYLTVLLNAAIQDALEQTYKDLESTDRLTREEMAVLFRMVKESNR